MTGQTDGCEQFLLNKDRVTFRGHIVFSECGNDPFERGLLVIVGNGDQTVHSVLEMIDSLDIFQDSPCPGLPPSGITSGNGQLHPSLLGPKRRAEEGRPEEQHKHTTEKTPRVHSFALSLFSFNMCANLAAFGIKIQRNLVKIGGSAREVRHTARSFPP